MEKHWGRKKGTKLTETHKKHISEAMRKAYAKFIQEKNQSNSKGRQETPNQPSPTTKQERRLNE